MRLAGKIAPALHFHVQDAARRIAEGAPELPGRLFFRPLPNLPSASIAAKLSCFASTSNSPPILPRRKKIFPWLHRQKWVVLSLATAVADTISAPFPHPRISEMGVRYLHPSFHPLNRRLWIQPRRAIPRLLRTTGKSMGLICKSVQPSYIIASLVVGRSLPTLSMSCF